MLSEKSGCDQPFEQLPEGYRLLMADLRSGNFGDVCRCWHIDRSDKIYVFKRIRHRPNKDEENEVLLLQKLQEVEQHPNIIELIQSDSIQNYLITPWYPKGDLGTFIKHENLHLREAKLLFTRIVTGVQFLHTNKVLHRDLKPGNIFLETDMNPRIGDFGLSKYMLQPGAAFCGTLSYMAPELLEIPESGYGLELDIWALGCIAYRLLERVSYLPSTETDKGTCIELMKKSFLQFRNLHNRDAQEIIRCMLVKNPSRRIKIDTLARCPFILDSLKPNRHGLNPTLVPTAELASSESTITKRLERKLHEILEASQSWNWGESAGKSLPTLEDVDPETWIRRFIDTRTPGSRKSGFVSELADGSITASYIDKFIVVLSKYKNLDHPRVCSMNAEMEDDWNIKYPHISYGFARAEDLMKHQKLLAVPSLEPERVVGDEHYVFSKLAARSKDGKYMILLSNGSLQFSFPENGSILLCSHMWTLTELSSETQNKNVYHLDDIKKHGCDPKLLDKLQFALKHIRKFRSHIEKCE